MKFLNFLFALCAINNNKQILIEKNYQKDIPLCKNCIYYKSYISYFENIESLARCSKFSYKDIISNDNMNQYAIICRQNEEQCGKFGKYFYNL